MTSAPVTDVNKFFANVTKLSSDAAGTVSSSPKQNNDAFSFADAMNNSAGKSEKEASNNENPIQKKTVVEKPGREVQKEDNSASVENGTKDTKITAEDKSTKDLAEKVSEKAGEIKDAIRKRLGVSEEELSQAMEVLGISLQDLLNPATVKDLMMQISGTEDAISLITNGELYDGVKEMMQLCEDVTTEIRTEFGVSDNEFESILKNSDLISLTEELPEDLKQLINEVSNEQFTKPVEMAPTIENNVDENNNDVNIASQNNSAEAVASTEQPTSGPVVEVVRENVDEQNGKRELNNSPSYESVEETAKVDENFVSRINVRNQTQSGTNQNNQDEKQQNLEGTYVPQFERVVAEAEKEVQNVESEQNFAQTIRNEQLMQQVTEYVKVNINADTTSMEMQLHPASLGTVNMQITSVNGEVTAHLTVQSEAVRAALETQLMTLQDTFDNEGMKVTAVEVSVANYDLDRGPSGDREDRHERQTAGAQKVRRRINLNDLSDVDLDGMNDDDQLAAKIMAENGNSVDFTA